jgi:hypothetical protein
MQQEVLAVTVILFGPYGGVIRRTIDARIVQLEQSGRSERT